MIGFTYGLSSKGTIHSFKNKVNKENMLHYFEGLIKLMDIKKSEEIITHYSIERLLNAEKKS